MLSTSQIVDIAKQLRIPNFEGVFAWNELPSKTFNKKKSYSFIINTDSSNLGGQHWLAVLVRPNKQGYVFDSYGIPPPLRVQTWLNSRGIRWSANNRQLQTIQSTLCGYYCIYFLWFANLLSDKHFTDLLNTLFPIEYNNLYKNDRLINDFVKLFNI